MQTKGNFLLLEKSEFRDWLKKQNVTRTINKLQVHHTYSPNYTTRKMKNGVAQQDHFACLEGMRNHHINTNKWSATGQNITVFEDGKIAISLDRNLNSTPAGIKNVNTGAICVEIIGNFDIGGDIVAHVQKDSVVHLYACLCEKFKLSPSINTIIYHAWFTSEGVLLSDYNAKLSAKSCPGSNFLGYGNTKVAANKSLIPWIETELKKLTSSTNVVQQIEQPYIITKERISLSNGKLKFHTLGTDKGKATDVRHVFIKKENIDKIKLVYEKGKKVSQLATTHRADLAINCTFYNMSNGIPSGHFKDSNLKTQSTAYGKTLKWKQFNINENKIGISDLDYKLNQACFQASPLIVEHGKDVSAKYIKEHEIQSDIATGKSQRTFMGWDKDDNIHIFVADGRTDWDIGLEPKIMTQYCLHHKMITAAIFDGGGSSIIVDGKLGSLNQSTNRGINERINHHALLFYFKETIKETPKPVENTTSKYREVNIMIDNKLTDFKGYLVNGSTYTPLRSIGESLGATIGWDSISQVASINGKKVTGLLIENRTYIPFRELGNLLNLTVDWDQNTFTAKYFTKK